MCIYDSQRERELLIHLSVNKPSTKKALLEIFFFFTINFALSFTFPRLPLGLQVEKKKIIFLKNLYNSRKQKKNITLLVR